MFQVPESVFLLAQEYLVWLKESTAIARERLDFEKGRDIRKVEEFELRKARAELEPIPRRRRASDQDDF